MGSQRAGEQPLAWGRHVSSGVIRHIHQVPTNENGAACGCVCPGCGSNLVAINADKDGEYLGRRGTLRPFFKHAGGKQSHSCLIRAARAAAMLLFMEQDSVWLPPRRSRGYDNEVLGHLAAIRPEELVTVAAKRWIDSLTGVLTLSDGSQVLVTARVDSEVTLAGEYSKVIRIDCSNPLVATMKPEKVIAMLRDPAGDLACWQKHDEDAALSQESAKLADEYLDGMPPELLAGLSKLHANETILHWLIKQAVLKSPFMHVPRQRGTLQSKRYRQLTADYESPATVLEILEPRLEKWTGDIVPDVVCKARVRGSSQEPFDLLIEAAVHHRVGPEKLRKIQELGIAAIEIRSDRFSRVGAVKASVIAREVSFDPSNKHWLLNPILEAQRAAAEIDLRKRESTLKQAEDRSAAAAKWHSDLNAKELYGLAYKLMKAQWVGSKEPKLPHADASLDSLRREIQLRTKQDILEASLGGRNGLLASVSAVEEAAFGLPSPVPLAALLERAQTTSFMGAPAGVYMLLGIECWQPLLSPKELACAKDLRAVIEGSFKMGSTQHARTRRLDDLVGTIFPRLKPLLEQEYGSLDYAHALHGEVQRVRREEARKAEAEGARVLNESFELKRLERQRLDQERELALIEAEIAKIDRTTGWCVVTPQNRALEAVVKLAESSAIVNTSSLPLLDVVHAAWHARNEGRSVGDALRELEVKAPEDVSFAAATWKRILMTRSTHV